MYVYIPGTYQVRPHLIQRIRSRWGLRLGGPSVRKEADWCISCYFKTILECVDSCWVNYTLVETVPSVNDSFTEKVASHIQAAEWPLVRVLSLKVNMLSKLITDDPVYILNACSRSALFRLSSSDHNPRCSNLLSYDNCLRSGIILLYNESKGTR